MGGGDGYGRDVGIGLVRFEGGEGASDILIPIIDGSSPSSCATSPPPRVGRGLGATRQQCFTLESPIYAALIRASSRRISLSWTGANVKFEVGVCIFYFPRKFLSSHLDENVCGRYIPMVLKRT